MQMMELLQPIFRWAHIVTGILWIGLLYFFNFVNAHFAAALDGGTKKAVVPELMPRALFWFRWGAAWTWLTGILLLMLVFYHGGLMFEPGDTWSRGAFIMVVIVFLAMHVYDIFYKVAKKNNLVTTAISFLLIAAVMCGMVHYGHFSYRSMNIHVGVMFGTIMAFNVWFRIWPSQKQIITAVKSGAAPDASLVALAGMRSKHNTYLSVPLVWTMINQHTVLWAGSWWNTIVAVALGWAVVWWLYKKSATVKGL